MALAKVLHGARARVNVGANTVGVFMNISYGVNYDAQPVSIIGRFAPVEIAYTGQEAITVTCSAWRVLNHGPHDPQGAQVPKVQDLLRHDDITLSIFDRQNPTTPIMVVTGCRPIGYQTTIDAKGLQQETITYMGLVLSDESGPQNEPGAVDLP